MKETGAEWKSEGKTGRGGRRVEGINHVHKMCTDTHTHTHTRTRTLTSQLSNDRVTDVVLVSIGRYPVLKNQFRLVKPLTHKS